MEIKEIWKTIEDYPTYMISNFGNVKSLKHGKEKLLKQGKDKDGYCQVSLWKESKQKTCKVHRLVATHFLPNPENLPQVNHKNESKTDNCVDNLEFCDAKYNANYGEHNKKLSIALKGKKQSQECIEKKAKARQKPIACYNKNGDLVALYTSIKQASELLNIFSTNIAQCCRGKYKSCGGYIFKYIKKAG